VPSAWLDLVIPVGGDSQGIGVLPQFDGEM